MTEAKKKRTAGFKTMDPARRREVAALGGAAAHRSGHAHEFTSEEAREAARKSWASRAKQPKPAPPQS